MPSCCLARASACIASVRARQRSRTASSAASGTWMPSSSPARWRRAILRASIRSVFTRSPGFCGISEGAATRQR
ncbi:MAG: hypothetical protein R3F11_26845 [Verrucomicrobiales bacterium]